MEIQEIQTEVQRWASKEFDDFGEMTPYLRHKIIMAIAERLEVTHKIEHPFTLDWDHCDEFPQIIIAESTPIAETAWLPKKVKKKRWQKR